MKAGDLGACSPVVPEWVAEIREIAQVLERGDMVEQIEAEARLWKVMRRIAGNDA